MKTTLLYPDDGGPPWVLVPGVVARHAAAVLREWSDRDESMTDEDRGAALWLAEQFERGGVIGS